jgi:hypothetical protein
MTAPYSTLFHEQLRTIAPKLPELREQDAYDILERAREWESRIIADRPGRDALLLVDYRYGSAMVPDELKTLVSIDASVLVTAEHATDVVRRATGKLGNADHGTAALAALMWEDESTTSIIPVGMQTGNAAVDHDHPIKTAVARLLPVHAAYASVHGMMPGKVLDTTDKREIHAIIGLGKNPNDISREAAERLLGKIRDLGLVGVVSNDAPHINLNTETGGPELKEDGTPKKTRLAALGAGSMANFVNSQVEAGLAPIMPVMQMELTRGVRLIPSDFESGWYRDDKARAMGVYAGYLLTKSMIESVREA